VRRLLGALILIFRGFGQCTNSLEQALARCLELVELFSLPVDFVTEFSDGSILVGDSCLEVDESFFARHVESPYIKMIGGVINRPVTILLYSQRITLEKINVCQAMGLAP